ncbi:unnamed protein product [Caenorhabditis brenneri]
MSLNSDNSSEIFNNVKISLDNHEYVTLTYCLVMTGILISIFVSCGSWCIYAAGKISEEASVYHFEKEFKPDDENSKSKFKRKPAGACRIQIERERNQRDSRDYLKLIAKSFKVWK